MFTRQDRPIASIAALAVLSAFAAKVNAEGCDFGLSPPTACEGTSVRLVSTPRYSKRHPARGVAVLAVGDERGRRYQAGERIENKEVVAIIRNLVLLRENNGHACFVAKRGTGDSWPAPAKDPCDVHLGDPQLHVRAVSATQYEVSRDLIGYIKTCRHVLAGVRFDVHEVQGRTVGVRIYGIRRRSLLGMLGLRNGDLVRAINGTPANVAIRGAFVRLRNAKRISVALTRRGSDVVMDYSIAAPALKPEAENSGRP